jgi:hypothetical protein
MLSWFSVHFGWSRTRGWSWIRSSWSSDIWWSRTRWWPAIWSSRFPHMRWTWTWTWRSWWWWWWWWRRRRWWRRCSSWTSPANRTRTRSWIGSFWAPHISRMWWWWRWWWGWWPFGTFLVRWTWSRCSTFFGMLGSYWRLFPQFVLDFFFVFGEWGIDSYFFFLLKLKNLKNLSCNFIMLSLKLLISNCFK